MFRMKSIFLKKVWWVLYELNRILSGQKLQTDVQRKDMELSSLLWNLFINDVSLV